jgi:membrane fusion protein, copper/silver efflux system
MNNSRRVTSRLLAATCLAFASSWAFAHGNEHGEAKATVGRAHVTITYAKPKLNGRDPLALIEPGKLWRLGADIPTTIETDGELNFGGTRVPKGKYFLLARLVQAGQWTLILSTQPIAKYEPSTKVAEAPLTLKQDNDSIEELAIQLTADKGQGKVDIAWGKYRLSTSFASAA